MGGESKCWAVCRDTDCACTQDGTRIGRAISVEPNPSDWGNVVCGSQDASEGFVIVGGGVDGGMVKAGQGVCCI